MEMLTVNPNRKSELPLYLEENRAESIECNMLKIVLLESGSAILRIRDKSSVVSAPVLLCLNAEEPFSILKAEGLTSRVLYFTPSIVNTDLNMENIFFGTKTLSNTSMLDLFYFLPFTEREAGQTGLIDINLSTERKLSLLLDTLKAQLINYEDHYWPCRCRSFLIELLFLIQHNWSKREQDIISLSDNSFVMNEILLYLHLNYNRKITIEELTEKFHTNRNTMNKRFRKEIGLPVVEYLIRLRIKVACMLLKDTTLPVTDIAERAGFEDISYWGRAFKRLIGLSPSNYRKQII